MPDSLSLDNSGIIFAAEDLNTGHHTMIIACVSEKKWRYGTKISSVNELVIFSILLCVLLVDE